MTRLLRYPSATLTLLALFGCAPAGLPAKPTACRVTEDGAPPAAVSAEAPGPRLAGPRLAERGIGGTGSPAGLVGTITGFASICLNGLEVAYDPAAMIEVDGTTQPASTLRIGEVATIRATAPTPHAGLVAQTLSVRHAVSGPIEAVLVPGPDLAGLDLIVAGQHVRLVSIAPGAAPLAVGDWVTISGLRDPSLTIIASRIDRRAPGEVVLTGRLVLGEGSARIAGTRLRGTLPATLDGQIVTVVGAYRGGVLAADALTPARPALAAGIAGTLVLETYAHAQDGRLALADGTLADLPAGLGGVPAEVQLLVVVLEQSSSGGLTAISLHNGQDRTAASALAPHRASTTRIGNSAMVPSAAAVAAHAASARGKAGKAGKGHGTAPGTPKK